MTKKLGRPFLPRGKAKGVVIGARFSPDESKCVHDAIRRSKKEKPEWVRSALLSAAGSDKV